MIVKMKFSALLISILLPFLSYANKPKSSKPQKINLYVLVMEEPKTGTSSTLMGTGLDDADILVIMDSDTLRQKSIFDRENIFKGIPVGSEVQVKVSKKGYAPQEKNVKAVLSDGPNSDINSILFVLKKE